MARSRSSLGPPPCARLPNDHQSLRSDGAPADARGLAPPHAGPLGRHTLILTTPSSPQHPDCFRCLAAPPRERAKPDGLSLSCCQLPAQCAAAACCSLPASLHTATA
eukprot:scaffold2422_cov120-Isochrysis_galbana.AAC.4